MWSREKRREELEKRRDELDLRKDELEKRRDELEKRSAVEVGITKLMNHKWFNNIGFVRGTLRVFIPKVMKSITKMFKKVKIKNLNLKVKVPAKTIGNVSDKISHIVDIVGAVKTNVHESITEEKWIDKIKNLRKIGPSILSSAVLGMALFGIYEVSNNFLDEKFKNHYWLSTFNPFLAGSLAGIGHGSLTYYWTVYGPRYFTSIPLPSTPIYLSSTLFCHVLTHSAVFGIYEVTKNNSLNITDSRRNDMIGVLCIIFAAIWAGAMQESLSVIMKPLENIKPSDVSVSLVRSLPRPILREVLSPGVLIASIIGFLAFEYGKEQIEGRLELE